MKALIDSVTYKSTWESKFGTLHTHEVQFYNEVDQLEVGIYNSKKKDQTYFKAGQEAEFEKQVIDTKNGIMTKIKPVREQKFTPYTQKVKVEQARYSGFAMSYAKDLVVADKLPFDQMLAAATKIYDHMVKLDKRENENS